MRKIALVLAMLLLVSMAVFAGGRRQADDQVRIALMMRNMDEQFLADYAANVMRLAAERGVTLNVQDAGGDAAAQLTQVQTLLVQGFRYFVIVPVVSELSDQFNSLIHAEGGAAAYSNIQPTTSSLLVGPNFFFASSPEFVAGRYQAQLMASFFERHPERAPGRVINMLLINGELGHPAQVNRRAGLMHELAALGFTVNIVAEGTANWNPDESLDLTNAWVAAFAGQFNAIAAQNDGMALGAVQALLQNGLFSDANLPTGTRLNVPVLGIDATAAALASMAAYELYATVLQDAIGQSTAAFDVIYQVATGTRVPGAPAGGFPAATVPIDEFPANDARVINQCFLVPFLPVDRHSDFFRASR